MKKVSPTTTTLSRYSYDLSNNFYNFSFLYGKFTPILSFTTAKDAKHETSELVAQLVLLYYSTKHNNFHAIIFNDKIQCFTHQSLIEIDKLQGEAKSRT